MSAVTVRKMSWVFYLIVLGSLFYSKPGDYWRSVWYDAWLFIIAGAVIFKAWATGQQYHWSVGLLLGYVLLSALWAFGWRSSYPLADLVVLVSLGKVAAYSFIAAWCVVSVADLADWDRYVVAKGAFRLICLLNAVAIVWQALHHVPMEARGGLFGNPSMSGSFIAVSFPFVASALIEENHHLLTAFTTVLCLTAVCLTGCNQPIALFFIVCLAAMARDNDWLELLRTDKVGLIAVGALVFIAGGIAWALMHLFHYKTDFVIGDSGRFAIWRLTMQSWWQHGHIWIGQGTGTSQVLVPMLEQMDLNAKLKAGAALPAAFDWWLWLHSDWLQLLFENGIIGAVLGMVMYGFAVVKAWGKNATVFAVTVGVGAMAVFNFPVHWPVHALFCATVLAMAFSRRGVSV